jgi:chorismate mutase
VSAGERSPGAGLAELARLREQIEAADRELVRVIAERVRLARAVGRAKRAAGLPTLDPVREAAVLRRATETAREAGLTEEDVRDIFWHLIGLSRRAQNEGAGEPPAEAEGEGEAR